MMAFKKALCCLARKILDIMVANISRLVRFLSYRYTLWQFI
jgi:hypothetical protein